jgi:heme exporter protein A
LGKKRALHRFLKGIFLIFIRNLSLRRQNQWILKSLSFGLHPGGCVVLQGPNGSGKTSLLKSIAGIIPPFSGEIITEPMVTFEYIGHQNALDRMLTVSETLSFFSKLSEENKVCHEGMRAFGIEGLLHKSVRTLSAGQRRQVCLSRLFFSKATVWLLDEPTTNLDQKAKDVFWRLMENHLKKRGGVILTSHEPVPLSQAEVVLLNG